MKKFLFISLATLFLGIWIPSVSFAQDEGGPVQEFAKKVAPTYVVPALPIVNEYVVLNAPDVLLFSEGNHVGALASIVPTEAILNDKELTALPIDAIRQIRIWVNIGKSKYNHLDTSFRIMNFKHRCSRNC